MPKKKEKEKIFRCHNFKSIQVRIKIKFTPENPHPKKVNLNIRGVLDKQNRYGGNSMNQ